MRARQTVSSVAPFTAVGSSTVGVPLVVRPGKGWAATGSNVGQWYLDGVAVSGATTYSYTPVSGDLGKTPTFIPVGLPYTVTGSIVASLPVVTDSATLPTVYAGQAVTWSAATATGTPAPTISYSLRKNGVEVSTTSGAYSDVTAGDVLQVVATASNAAGAVTNNSAAVTVSSALGDPYMIATHRLNLNTGYTTVGSGQQTILGAVTHYSPDYPTYGHRLLFTGYRTAFVTNTETDLANDVVYTGASLEIGGVRYPLTLNGSTTFTVPAGSAGVLLDPLPDSVVVPANSAFREIVLIQGQAVGQQRLANANASSDIPNTAPGLNDGIVVNNGSTDLSSFLTGTGAINFTPGFGAVPIPSANCIIAKGWAAANASSKREVVLLAGDSIGQGEADGNFGANLWPLRDGVTGDTSRGLSSRTLSSASYGAGAGTSRFVPHLNVAVYGTDFAVDAKFPKRKQTFALMDYPWTTVLSEMGSNNNNTGTTLRAQYQAHVDFWRGQKSATKGTTRFVQTTIWGRANYTDATIGAATVANQVANSVSAANINPLIRGATVTGQDAWIERQGIVHAQRTGLDDYAWLPGTQATLQADYAANATTMVLDVAPAVGEVLMIAPGTANKSNGFVVVGVALNTPTAGKVTVTGKIGQGTAAVTTGGTVVGIRTIDGIHGLNTAYQLTAEQAIIPAKVAGVLQNAAM